MSAPGPGDRRAWRRAVRACRHWNRQETRQLGRWDPPWGDGLPFLEIPREARA